MGTDRPQQHPPPCTATLIPAWSGETRGALERACPMLTLPWWFLQLLAAGLVLIPCIHPTATAPVLWGSDLICCGWGRRANLSGTFALDARSRCLVQGFGPCPMGQEPLLRGESLTNGKMCYPWDFSHLDKPAALTMS